MPAPLAFVFVLLGLLLFVLDGLTVAAARGGNNNNSFNNFNKPNQFHRDNDPYQVLGVKRTASDDEIQKSYRKRAKETHPDKNFSPNATDEFRRVTTAFEILGDPVNRKRYDRAIKEEEAKKRRSSSHNQYRQSHQKQSSTSSRKPNNMDRKSQQKQQRQSEMRNKSKAAQSRLLKITTKAEFETTMLDPSKKYYRTNCLILFVSNKQAEKWAETQLYFPYPFVGSDAGYEKILNVGKVRFNTQTELTRHFHTQSNSNIPHIIFARKGDAVRNFQVFKPKKLGSSTRNYDAQHLEFQQWVESQLVFHITVANRHALPVQVRILRHGRTIIFGDTSSLKPNYERAFALHVGDRIIAFDERIDTYPGAIRNEDNIAMTNGVLLLDVIVTSSLSHESYAIPPRRCYDLSTQCHQWIIPLQRGKKQPQQQQSCHIHPEFMHQICPYTCGVCTEQYTSDISYFAFHRPIHSFPVFLWGIVRFGRDLLVDIDDMVKQHTSVALALFAVGLLLALNIASSHKKSKLHPMSQFYLNEVGNGGRILDVSLLLCSVAMTAWMVWITNITRAEVPSFLQRIHSEMIGVANFTDAFILIIAFGVIAGVYFRSFLSCSRRGDIDAGYAIFFILSLLAIVSCFILVAVFCLSSGNVYHMWEHHIVAVSMVVLVGAIVGVGLVSMERLIISPMIMKLPFLAFLCNLIVLSVVGYLALVDPQFADNFMIVIRSRKDSAVAAVLIGMVIGHMIGNNLNILDSEAYKL